MSRPIKMTKEYADKCRKEFEALLQKTRLLDGKISFTKSIASEPKKTTVTFTSNAWTKMVALIQSFDKEVAWHGVAFRDEDNPDGYVITDILVYPQTVSSAYVDMGTGDYAKWLEENADDERFEHIAMQGHSHVNMEVSPSTTDLKSQSDIANMLGDDDFYIFMIWNKSLKSNIRIYDLRQNTLYEDGDVTVKVGESKECLADFLASAKKMVKDHSYYVASSAKSIVQVEPPAPKTEAVTAIKKATLSRTEKPRVYPGSNAWL